MKANEMQSESKGIKNIVIALINIVKQNTILLFDPLNAYANYEKGCSLGYLKKYNNAIKHLTLAVENGFENDLLHYVRGICFEEINKKKQAIEDYTKAINLNPRNAGAYYNRGNLFIDIEEDSAAEKDFKKNIEIDPNSAKPYIGLAYLCYKRRNYEEAIKYYSEGVNLNQSFFQYVPDELANKIKTGS